MKLLQGSFLAVTLLILMVNGGCKTAETPFHLAGDVDLSYIKKVAVLPLDNLTNDKYAADAVRQVVVNELLLIGLVDVALPGDATVAMEKSGVRDASYLNTQKIKEIAGAMKVQAVILGAVEKYGEVRSGSFTAPEVTITLMMADAETGGILWSVTRTAVGDSFMARHFGARSESLSELTVKVVRECIGTLAQYSR